MVLLLFHHTFLPISMWKLTVFHRYSWSQTGIFFLALPKQLSNFRVNWRWISWLPNIPINVSFIKFWKITTSRSFGVNGFNHLWKFCMSYLFPLPASIPLVLSMLLAEHVTNQFSLLIIVAPFWMESPWLPTVLNMLEDFFISVLS